MKNGLSLYWLCVLLVACSVWAQKNAKPIGTFSSRTDFTGTELFRLLDSIGNNGNWMLYDSRGIQDPSVAKILKDQKRMRAVWGLNEPGLNPKVAILFPKGNGEELAFYSVNAFDASPVALAVHDTLNPEQVFSDFKKASGDMLVHADEPSLRVRIQKSGIYFSYIKPDVSPLRFDRDFLRLSENEKRQTVREYADFFRYEYAVALRAFVQSVHGVFNWQVWHWYLPEWNSRYLISDEEIRAILLSGEKPVRFRLFQAVTARGVRVVFWADGNGRYEAEIVRER